MTINAGSSKPLLDVTVRGIPAPQGSKRAYVNRYTGRAALTESSKKVRPWRDAVRSSIAAQWLAPTLDEPLRLWVVFAFARPAGHFGTGRNATVLKASAPISHTGKPDLDKLVRSTMDAIKDAGVVRDDSRIVEITAYKLYVGGLMEHPGAHIIIRRMTP